MYYLAIDIGASGGRHVLGYMQDGKLVIEEIYRFDNGMIKKNGHLCWDIDAIFKNIIKGLKKCKEIGKVPSYMGIDTWGVDFVLLDGENKIVGQPVAYRDSRTDNMMEKVFGIIPKHEMYNRTGVSMAVFNTIYQLMAIKEQSPQQFTQARHFLLLAGYFHMLLTGNKKNEYTNATTTQMVNPATSDWDYDMLKMLGFPIEIFSPVCPTGSIVGDFTSAIADEVGFSCTVVLPPTHDTAASVLAVPMLTDDSAYISSGTWSLLGIETDSIDCSSKGLDLNFTNEGGYGGKIIYLKNIMGLWMLQSVRRELRDEFSYEQLCHLASMESIPSIVDCNDSRFFSPESMIKQIQEACSKNGMIPPVTPGQFAAVIYNSLAVCYAKTMKELEDITGKQVGRLHIVGGGSKADYLNQLAANYSGKEVWAGPFECTALGNILSQMLYNKQFSSINAARQCVLDSFPIKKYKAARKV